MSAVVRLSYRKYIISIQNTQSTARAHGNIRSHFNRTSYNALAQVSITRRTMSSSVSRATNTAGKQNTLYGEIRPSALVDLPTLSKAVSEELGSAYEVRIVAKCEHLHPTGSVKERAASYLITTSERSGKLQPGGTLVQGTGGNTGISMAMIAASKGYKCYITIPENISTDKIGMLKMLGAEVESCPCVPFGDERHYMERAKKYAAETPGAVLPDQFENLANSAAHFDTTGPEIWSQLGGGKGGVNAQLDGFVCAAGTGGTIAGVSRYLKMQCVMNSYEKHNPHQKSVATYLIDPTGSGLKCFVEDGVFASSGSCFIDGIGISRETANFKTASVDGAFRGNDTEAVEMAHFLLRNEGLFVGPSAALNCVGAVKLVRRLAKQWPTTKGASTVHEGAEAKIPITVCTILCDSGERYRATTFNSEWLEEKGLTPTFEGRDISFVKQE
ncbi:hypothetical protein SARC_02116 [Sphaeroforma arctica JP610]|uniref:Tryptophan synthase beta chain-like PALP domain-containing protein n=1 Tax=Sphaeroforma arctica JP610 TaxID=667725 RepID=A0A0L0G9M7_9EUKA|nr:hypothetical protein SARC_02116 [Sphaeroforma arctica JP610]KNC85705.1 hypothetical protein SARC_02116 [Sphaeroforma arctica JP610]|eukprot:XP_014159607.1 hypothetical protein SARC_02116 [Sphaeroforma arctica JP610]